jgi:hypothetical protein
MVLLHKVVEIFGLADTDWRFTIGIDGFECSESGAAFVDGYSLGTSFCEIDFLKKRRAAALSHGRVVEN